MRAGTRVHVAVMMGLMAVVLAVACGMPEAQPGDGELGAAQAYAKRKPGDPGIPPAAVYALKVTDAEVAGQVPVGGTSFTISRTIDLFVAVDYQNVCGAHQQLVQFFSPDGSYYQGFNRNICIGPACTADRPETIGAVSQYWVTLPVAGLAISQYNLTGAWRVDLYIDGVKKTSTGFLFL